jgi:uncharacterized protein
LGFDLAGVRTYDTRPMPNDGSKLCGVAVLADEERRVELLFPVARLELIAPRLLSTEGVVTGSIAFSRQQGRIVADVEAAAQFKVRCERCLEPMTLLVQGGSQVVLVASEAEAAEVPPEFETALAPDGRVRPADLIEEELLLSLPEAARHAGACGAGQSEEKQAENLSESTQRPFADLGKLLRR